MSSGNQDVAFVHVSCALQTGDEDRLKAFLGRPLLKCVYKYAVQPARREWEGLAPSQIAQHAWIERSESSAGDAAATHRALDVLVADARTLHELRSLPAAEASASQDQEAAADGPDVSFVAVLVVSQDLDDFSEELAEVLAEDDLDRDMDHPDRAQRCSRKLEAHCDALKQARTAGGLDWFWAPASAAAKGPRQHLVDAQGRHAVAKVFSARATLRGADELFSAASVNGAESTFDLSEDDLVDGIFRGYGDGGAGEDGQGDGEDEGDLDMDEGEEDDDDDDDDDDEDIEGVDFRDGHLFLKRQPGN